MNANRLVYFNDILVAKSFCSNSDYDEGLNLQIFVCLEIPLKVF